MTILAIDIASAKPQAYSLWKNGKLIAYGTIELIDLIRTIRNSKVPLAVAVENIYSARKKEKANFKVYKQLAEVCGAIKYTAIEKGYEFLEPYASEWQLRILPIKPLTPRPERMKWAKTIAKAIVKEHLGKEAEVNDDEATAICLGQYVSSREEFKGRLEDVQKKEES